MWRGALLQLLVDKNTVKAITGGKFLCSGNCLTEDGEENKKSYKFVDTSRFKLHNCIHQSRHLQCILTMLLNYTCLTACPIMDTPQCRGSTDDQGKYGQAHFWAPEDYENFAKAFFRNEKLDNAFLKPQFR